MKVSIITVCFNSEKTIRDTIESAINQTYQNIEYIIIDGGSTDNTLDIIYQYNQKIEKIISEPDTGIYDALNKGIKLSSGDIVGILHSNDILANSKIIEVIVKTFSKYCTEALYGNLIYIKNESSTLHRKWISGEYKINKFLLGWMPPHPTIYFKRNLFEMYGYYRLDFGSAADYELIIRFFFKHKISCNYIDKTIYIMRTGGVSNFSISNRLKAHKYDWLAWKENEISKYPFWVFLKPLRKIPQYL